MPSRTLVLFALVVGLGLTPPARAEENADEKLLKTSAVPTDGPGLITYFQKRTLADDTRAKVARLIHQLGADTFKEREQAGNELEDLGGLVRAQLAQATKDDDAEIRRRARRILIKLGPASAENALYPVAARVLASRKPAGAAKALLDFLPCVEDVDVAEEVARSLAPVALGKDGKADPAVLAALTDRFAIKRYSAAEALIAVGGAAHRPAAKKLLADPESVVRRHVAVALLMAREKSAVPTLLELLKAKSSDDADAAEDALALLAGEDAPTPENDSRPAHDRHVKNWENWWKEKGEKIDLAKLDLTGTGRATLVALLSNNMVGGRGRFSNGSVMELDNNGKVRWEIKDLMYPVHVSKHRRDRVLICEYQRNRVTERDLTGKIVGMDRNVNGQIVSAERLPNGHTFIVTRNQILELDAKGAEVVSIPRNAYDCLCAKRMKDGKIHMISSQGQFIRLDASGRELKKDFIQGVNAPLGFSAHFLPRGGVVVPDYNGSKVREYDASGKMIWEVDVQNPGSVVRLGNGNTLVASRATNALLEINKAGKSVKQHIIKGTVLFADRR
jgi:hypothetical protein